MLQIKWQVLKEAWEKTQLKLGGILTASRLWICRMEGAFPVGVRNRDSSRIGIQRWVSEKWLVSLTQEVQMSATKVGREGREQGLVNIVSQTECKFHTWDQTERLQFQWWTNHFRMSSHYRVNAHDLWLFLVLIDCKLDFYCPRIEENNVRKSSWKHFFHFVSHMEF